MNTRYARLPLVNPIIHANFITSKNNSIHLISNNYNLSFYSRFLLKNIYRIVYINLIKKLNYDSRKLYQ